MGDPVVNIQSDAFKCIADQLLPFGDILLATPDIIASGVSGIGTQFREDAQVYAARYSIKSKHKTIELGLAGSKTTLPDTIVALDIGCGPGDTTIALLEMFKNAHVYSTDLSPEMLMLLVAKAKELRLSDRITPFVADASAVNLKHEAFDLIVGSSMIHHLMDPDTFLDKVLKSLKPNGIALFYEPFQAGHIVLRTILANIVEIAPYRRDLSDQRTQFFKNYIYTIDVMCADDRDPSTYASLDDKFMFARSIFSNAAERNNCHVAITPTNPPEDTFASKIKDLLRQGLGDTDPLPKWCAELIAQTDHAISRSARTELLIEACITFTRH